VSNYWSFYAPTKSWIEIDRDGLAVYARDERMTGRRTLHCHATGPEAPTGIPTLPADLTEIRVEVAMEVTLKVVRKYGSHFSPSDRLYLSRDDMEMAWENMHHLPGAIRAVITKVTGFDKKYQCGYF